MTKPQENQTQIEFEVAKIASKHLDKLLKGLDEMVEDKIQARFEANSRAMKIREESLFSSIETVLSALKMVEKTINYKLGAIEAKKTKAEVVEVTSLDDALAMANKIRAERGLPLIQIPQSEAHELNDK